MSASSEHRVKDEQKGGYWAYVPVLLMVCMVGGLASMAAIAVDDPGFSVEPDYYKKAVEWDQHQAQEAENQRLGWQLEMRAVPASRGKLLLRVNLTDRAGRPLPDAELTVAAFPNARANQVVTAALKRDARGRYLAELPGARAGLWEFRFVVERSGQRFTKVVRSDLAGDAT